VVVVLLLVAAGAGVLLRELQGGAAVRASGPPASPTSVLAAADQPGPKSVSLVADVAAHPQAEQVRTLLQDYFHAINTGDYELWRSTVTADQVRDTAWGAWHQQYRSTLDGNIVVQRLEPRPGGGLVALLSFTSVQDPADAPRDLPVRCLRWRVSYPLVSEAGELRIGPAAPTAALHAAC
jgi:hypothetical protein